MLPICMSTLIACTKRNGARNAAAPGHDNRRPAPFPPPRTHPHTPKALHPTSHTQAVAIVSNHISFLDILVHMAHSFPSFAAREGTQNIRMIGIIR